MRFLDLGHREEDILDSQPSLDVSSQVLGEFCHRIIKEK